VKASAVASGGMTMSRAGVEVGLLCRTLCTEDVRVLCVWLKLRAECGILSYLQCSGKWCLFGASKSVSLWEAGSGSEESE